MEKWVLKIHDRIENRMGSAADTPPEDCILVGAVHEEAPSSDRHRSLGLWKYWLGFELLYVLASEERVLQRRNRVFCFNVYRAPTQGLERVLWYVYPQPDDRASPEVDDGVNSDHFQVQLNSTGPFHGTGHHQGSTDRSRLPHVEFPALVPWFDLEDVIGSRVASCCLHLKDVGRHWPPRHNIHDSVQDGEWLISAARVFSWTHAAVISVFPV